MKRKTTLLVLAVALTMILGSFQSVFAATGKPTDETREAIENAGVQCIQVIKNEVDAEKVAKDLHDQTAAGKYKLVDTATMKSWIDSKENMLVVDTMPDEGWYAYRHIPGAVCQIVGANNSPKFEILPEEAAGLLAKVKAYSGTKTVTTSTKYYWNKKSKKWQTKKPSKKKWGKCTKKKDKFYGKKTKTVKKTSVVDVKDKKIVVYCGFTKCQRSHQAAMYLVSQGYTNVYRYAGGISAWVDADYDIEGKDVEAPALEAKEAPAVEAAEEPEAPEAETVEEPAAETPEEVPAA